MASFSVKGLLALGNTGVTEPTETSVLHLTKQEEENRDLGKFRHVEGGWQRRSAAGEVT